MVIDTAPRSESTALAAARAADLVLIPCRPTILDRKAIGNSADLAALAKKPAAVVLNAVRTRAGSPRKLRRPCAATTSRSRR
ncbi:MAG: P-loop NTPase family protein [Steroidobacteraceae bacterium]